MNMPGFLCKSAVRASALAAAAAIAAAALPGCQITFVPAGTAVVRQGGAPPPPQQQQAPAADAELEQLVAPIALYPDPILAELLPASTYPDQVTDAGHWLQEHPNPSQEDIDAQNWAPAVKAMVHYPSALQQLNNDPQWTQSLGSAVTQDQASVMAAIQDMRQQAKSVGNLTDNAQASVVTNGDNIAIEPANPDVVYVPQYDPVTVYVQPAPIVWGVGFSTGVWLGCGLDWGAGTVIVGNWHGPWHWDHGHWGYDAHWNADHFHGWHHDDHFGRAPHFDRSHWAVARSVRGREATFHRAVAHHNEIRNTRRAPARRDVRSAPSRGAPARSSHESSHSEPPRALDRGRGVP